MLTVTTRTYLLTTREVSKLTGYSQGHIKRLCREGKLEAQKIGRDYIMVDDAVEHLSKGVKNAL